MIDAFTTPFSTWRNYRVQVHATQKLFYAIYSLYMLICSPREFTLDFFTLLPLILGTQQLSPVIHNFSWDLDTFCFMRYFFLNLISGLCFSTIIGCISISFGSYVICTDSSWGLKKNKQPVDVKNLFLVVLSFVLENCLTQKCNYCIKWQFYF